MNEDTVERTKNMKRLIDVSRFAIKDSADTLFSKVADIVFESV